MAWKTPYLSKLFDLANRSIDPTTGGELDRENKGSHDGPSYLDATSRIASSKSHYRCMDRLEFFYVLDRHISLQHRWKSVSESMEKYGVSLPRTLSDENSRAPCAAHGTGLLHLAFASKLVVIVWRRAGTVAIDTLILVWFKLLMPLVCV